MKPLLYFPTTIMMVDDNKAYLENVSLNIGNKLPQCLFQNPESAIQVIVQKTFLSQKVDHYMKHININEYDEENYLAKLDFLSLCSLIYEQDRFSEISTVLVDYSMPKINGIDFCKKLQDLPIKKIMVTGEVGYDLAVDAFNKNIIDAFVVKNIDNIFEEIRYLISQSVNKYFIDISLLLNTKNIVNNSKNYQDIYDGFTRDYKIIEYYAIDENGSYLGLDEVGNIYWLVVKSDSDRDKDLIIAKDANADAVIIEKLTRGDHLLFLFSEIEKRMPVNAWEKFIFQVDGSFMHMDRKYSYSIIQNNYFSLIKEKIRSYSTFLNKVDEFYNKT